MKLDLAGYAWNADLASILQDYCSNKASGLRNAEEWDRETSKPCQSAYGRVRGTGLRLNRQLGASFAIILLVIAHVAQQGRQLRIVYIPAEVLA